MYVHPFWFGVLITLVVEIIVVCIAGFIMVRKGENDGEAKSNSQRNQ